MSENVQDLHDKDQKKYGSLVVFDGSVISFQIFLLFQNESKQHSPILSLLGLLRQLLHLSQQQLKIENYKIKIENLQNSNIYNLQASPPSHLAAIKK